MSSFLRAITGRRTGCWSLAGSLALIIAGPAHSAETATTNITPPPLFKFDGSLRERYEWSDHRDLGLNGGRDSAFLERGLFGARLTPTPWLSGYAQIGTSFASTRPEGNKPTDRHPTFLSQGYVDLTGPDTAWGTGQLRIGRQEIPLGSLHLMGTRDGPNVRRAFDAVRANWRYQDQMVSAFIGHPLQIEESHFYDHPDNSQKIWGLYATGPNQTLHSGLDLYGFGFENKNAHYVSGSGHERRYTVGARLFGKADGFDWDNEAAGQFGRFNEQDIRAWSASAQVGYTLAQWQYTPRIGLKTGIASGDRHPHDGQLNTFNAMYPKLPYLTENGIVAPANLMDVSPSLQITPLADLMIEFSLHEMWRQQRADAFWVAPGRPVKGTEGGSRYLGQQTQIEANWAVLPSVQVKLAWAWFDVSHRLEQAGLHDMNFVMTSATWTF